MRKIALNIIIVILVSSCNAQKTEQQHSVMKDSVIIQANRMMMSLNNKDYNSFIDKMYPKLVEKFGGKDKMLEGLNLAYEKLDKQGIKIDSVIFSNPRKIIEVGAELQTTVIETLIMSIPQGKMVKKSTLIVISPDKGLTWYFLDTAGSDLNMMKSGFPNLSDSLIIEKEEKPIVYNK
ncbi:MAG: hypothetical protein Q8910_14705 [Bacteroidota bacterium]|nr:hypothetical protein [Bacteroidota bacterium]